MKRAEVMMPSQPSFWTPGRPARNLSVTSLPRPALRKLRARNLQDLGLAVRRVLPSRRSRWIWKRASARVVDLAEVVVEARRLPSSARSASTMRQEARLSSAVPHSTAFLPPAFMATLPPMQEASAEVGSHGEHEAGRLGRFHHAPRDHAGAAADASASVAPRRAATSFSTAPRRSSFSVLMTADSAA